MNAFKLPKIRHHLLLGAALAAMVSLPLQASPVMIAGSASANAASTANVLEFTLFNSGPGAITVGAFSLEISVPSANVAFTAATTATAQPYVFAGDSLFGPDIGTAFGQTLNASDLCNLCAGGVIAAGATVGLAHILFDVLAGAPPGPLTVSIAGFPSTSLSDTLGNDLPATLQNGIITINANGTAVPEPATLALLALSALILAGRRFRGAGAASNA